MNSNLGRKERFIRMAAALGLIIAGALWRPLFAGLGALLLLTALVGWCPLWALLHISTTPFPQQLPTDSSAATTEADRRRFK